MIATIEPIAQVTTLDRPAEPTASASPLSKPASDLGRFGAELTAAAAERSVHISAHAAHRLDQRGIALDDGHLDRLTRAFDQLAAKGARSSLVWLDQVGYIVHVPTQTVVTAVPTDDGKENVFTQIDSVAIA